MSGGVIESTPPGNAATMKNRLGVTLTEVLVAIFVMGVGLLSLLVLFPVGALNMAQAIKDERAAHAAQTADVVARLLNVRDDSYILDWNNSNPAVFGNAPRPPAYYLYTYPTQPPNPGDPQLLPIPWLAYNQSQATGITMNINTVSSYPVFIDPIGYSLGSRRLGYVIGQSPGIPRTSVTFLHEPGLPNVRPLPTPPAMPPNYTEFFQPPAPPQPPYPVTNPPAYPYPLSYSLPRWFSNLDELNYAENGTPQLVGGNVQRETRYSWAYMCRQTRADIKAELIPNPPTSSLIPDYLNAVAQAASPPYTSTYDVDLTIILYDRRPWLSTVTGTQDFCAGETTYNAVFTKGQSIATLSWAAGQTPPSIRRGTWILDVTLQPTFANQVVGGVLKPGPLVGINGYFYRVLNATNTSPTTMDVELHRPSRANATAGFAVVMENVVEVFERGKY